MKITVTLLGGIVAAMLWARSSVVDISLLPLLVGLLVAHLDRESGAMAERLVRCAARLLPARDRAIFEDQWIDHVRSAGEHGLLPLMRALSILTIGAPALAVGLRLGRGKRRVSR